MAKKKKSLWASQNTKLPMNGNYLRKIMALTANGSIKSGTVAVIHVYHDEWCEINYGGECNCDPDVSVEPADPGR